MHIDLKRPKKAFVEYQYLLDETLVKGDYKDYVAVEVIHVVVGSMVDVVLNYFLLFVIWEVMTFFIKVSNRTFPCIMR